MTIRLILLLLALALGVSACDSGSVFERPGPRDAGAADGADPPRKKKYDFSLPVGETSADVNEGNVYAALAEGDCAEAQQALDGTQQNFRVPNYVHLFQAGVHLCEKDRDAAETEYAQVVWRGSSGVWFICEMYRAVGSVIKDRSKASLGKCPPIIPLGSTSVPPESPDPLQSNEPEPEVSPTPEPTS